MHRFSSDLGFRVSFLSFKTFKTFFPWIYFIFLDMFLTQNVKNRISVKIAPKYAPVDKVWTGVTQWVGVSVNLAGQGWIVRWISMNVIMKPYVEMKRYAKTLKGLTSAIVKTDLVWIVVFAKVKKDVTQKKKR